MSERLEDRCSLAAEQASALGDHDTARVLRLVASVADMARRVAERPQDAFYRREKSLRLLDDALDLVIGLAELDAGELDDDTFERLHAGRRTWQEAMVAAAAAMWAS